eukprot:365747-Chlamydomonas_euryale.AAC.69
MSRILAATGARCAGRTAAPPSSLPPSSPPSSTSSCAQWLPQRSPCASAVPPAPTSSSSGKPRSAWEHGGRLALMTASGRRRRCSPTVHGGASTISCFARLATCTASCCFAALCAGISDRPSGRCDVAGYGNCPVADHKANALRTHAHAAPCNLNTCLHVTSRLINRGLQSSQGPRHKTARSLACTRRAPVAVPEVPFQTARWSAGMGHAQGAAEGQACQARAIVPAQHMLDVPAGVDFVEMSWC